MQDINRTVVPSNDILSYKKGILEMFVFVRNVFIGVAGLLGLLGNINSMW